MKSIIVNFFYAKIQWLSHAEGEEDIRVFKAQPPLRPRNETKNLNLSFNQS